MTKKVLVTLTDEQIAILDQMRGEMPRSAFIRQVLENNLEDFPSSSLERGGYERFGYIQLVAKITDDNEITVEAFDETHAEMNIQVTLRDHTTSPSLEIHLDGDSGPWSEEKIEQSKLSARDYSSRHHH